MPELKINLSGVAQPTNAIISLLLASQVMEDEEWSTGDLGWSLYVPDRPAIRSRLASLGIYARHWEVVS